jgi:hypothetical protein
MRRRQPSVPELNDRLNRLEHQVEEITGSHDITPDWQESVRKQPTSTPPAFRWVQRKVGQIVLKLAGVLLVAFAGAAGGWLFNDCLHHVERQRVPPGP